MAIWGGSSNNRARINSDGTRNIFCWNCHCYITRSYLGVGKALCEMCRRVENGEVLTEEAIKEYDLSKLGHENVNMLYLQVETPEVAKKFTLRGLTGEFLSAIGFKKQEIDKDVPSVKVAKGKRRAPLFSKVTLGSMTEIDKELKKQSEEQ